jgi:hypothetical protein
MPHEHNARNWRSRFRVSVGGLMVAVFVLSCSFATWRVLSSGFKSWAMLQTFDPKPEFRDQAGPTLDPKITPAILEAAAARLNRKSSEGLAAGLEMVELPPNVFAVQRQTGDGVDDDAVVKAVAESLIASYSPGTLRLHGFVRIGAMDDDLVGISLRGGASILAGLAALAMFWFARHSFRAFTDLRRLRTTRMVLFEALR